MSGVSSGGVEGDKVDKEEYEFTSGTTDLGVDVVVVVDNRLAHLEDAGSSSELVDDLEANLNP